MFLISGFDAARSINGSENWICYPFQLARAELSACLSEIRRSEEAGWPFGLAWLGLRAKFRSFLCREIISIVFTSKGQSAWTIPVTFLRRLIWLERLEVEPWSQSAQVLQSAGFDSESNWNTRNEGKTKLARLSGWASMFHASRAAFPRISSAFILAKWVKLVSGMVSKISACIGMDSSWPSTVLIGCEDIICNG